MALEKGIEKEENGSQRGKIIRKFEHSMRNIGRRIDATLTDNDDSDQGGTVLGYIIDDWENKKEIYVRSNQSQ